MVAKGAAIAAVMGVTNAVAIDADAVGEITLVGPGAGGEATASAVVADITDIASGRLSPPFGLPVDQLAEPRRAPMQRHEGGYYVRLSVYDHPGAAAAIATRFAERKISLESILQKGRARKPVTSLAKGLAMGSAESAVPVVLITYATAEGAIRAALDAVTADGHIAEPPQVIRIERD
jgi:homoserine dehydrogenase